MSRPRVASAYRWTELEMEWDEPDWGAGGKVHNWRNYVTEKVRALWPTFTEQRQALYEQADEIAGREEWD
jgi:hypothetical protein